MAKFDKDLNIIENENINSEIESDYSLGDKYYAVNGYCITLIPEYGNYIFIIDGDFDGTTSGRGYLFPNDFKPEEILPNPLMSSFTTNIIPSTTISKSKTATTIITETVPITIPMSLPITISTSSPIITSKYTTTPISTFIKKPLSTINSKYTTIPISTSVKKPLSTLPLISHSYSSSIKQNSFSTLIQKNEKNNDIEISNVQCSFEYFYKNIKTNECQKLCSYNEIIEEICFINDLNENNIMNITEHFRNLMRQLDINKNINVVINGNNAVYQVISSEVMEENIDKNISIIDFGDCEKKLKDMLGIDYILILQIDVFLSTSTNIVLKYEVYNPNNLEKVDLSVCEDMTINTYLPYSISDEELELYINLKESGYNLFNPNDSFYQDSCTPYTSENNTDMVLSDRRIDLYKNISFCEEGCTYKDYDYVYKKVQCECPINNEIDNNINDINFMVNIIKSSFFEFDSYSNIKTLKCIKLVFSKLGQTKNI